MKDKNKRILTYIITVIILFILIFGVVFYLKENQKNTEAKLENEFKDIISQVYVDIYEKKLEEETSEEVISFFKTYSFLGLTIDLEIINSNEEYKNKYSEELKNFNNKAGKCDEKETKAIVFPVEPFDKNDFNIEVNLSCDKVKK